MLLGVGISCTISTIKNHGDKRVSIFGTLFKTLCNQVFEKAVLFLRISFATFGSSSSYNLKWKPINRKKKTDKNWIWNKIKPFSTFFCLRLWLNLLCGKKWFSFQISESTEAATRGVLYKKVFLKMSQC